MIAVFLFAARAAGDFDATRESKRDLRKFLRERRALKADDPSS
jgi:hypothetical protein